MDNVMKLLNDVRARSVWEELNRHQWIESAKAGYVQTLAQDRLDCDREDWMEEYSSLIGGPLVIHQS